MRPLRPLVAAWVVTLAGCDCVAGGIEAYGELYAEVPPAEPSARLCTAEVGGTCVVGEIYEEDGRLRYDVAQGSSAAGDQIGECNDKRWLVVEAANCRRFTHHVDGSVFAEVVALDCW